MIEDQRLANSSTDPVFFRFTPHKTPPFRFWNGEMSFFEYGDGWTISHTCFDGLVEIPEDELPKTARKYARKPSLTREGPPPTCGHQSCQDEANGRKA